MKPSATSNQGSPSFDPNHKFNSKFMQFQDEIEQVCETDFIRSVRMHSPPTSFPFALRNSSSMLQDVVPNIQCDPLSNTSDN